MMRGLWLNAYGLMLNVWVGAFACRERGDFSSVTWAWLLAQGVAVSRYLAVCGASPSIEAILHARRQGTLRSLAWTAARGRISPIQKE